MALDLDTGLPARYWHVCSISDAGRDVHVCEACRERTVRFVIRVAHGWCRRRPGVGGCCAGDMTGEGRLIAEGVAYLLERQRKREHWLREGWRLSQAGNFVRRQDNVTVYRDKRRDGRWKYVIGGPGGPRHSEPFGSEALARAACFDRLFPPVVEAADRLHLAARPDWENE
jgi:hypothetical protein